MLPVFQVSALLLHRVEDPSVNFGLFEAQIPFVLHISLPEQISALNLQSSRHLSISVLHPTNCWAWFADTLPAFLALPSSAQKYFQKINSFFWQTSIALLLNKHFTKAEIGGERQLPFPSLEAVPVPRLPCSQHKAGGAASPAVLTAGRKGSHKTANVYSHSPLLTILPTRFVKGSL